MTSFFEEEGVLRVPATSPCRRDYQLRSCSPTQLSECETTSSRPHSPWLPRLESRSVEVSAFRLFESNPAPLDRSNYYSGPLRDVHEGVSRSYYSGPLPSPMPSYFSGFTTGGSAFRAGARGYYSGCQPAAEMSSVSGRLPEVGSSRESSFREESVAERDDDDDDVGEVLYTSYLSKEDERTTPRSSSRAASPLAVNLVAQKPRMRNCVSGELGMGLERVQQRAQVARGYKSGEIVGLDIRADGIYPMRSEVEALVKGGREISIRKQVAAEPIAWEENERPSSKLAMAVIPLNDDENERLNAESSMVAIPFKWEEMPEKNSTKMMYSRTSSLLRPARNMREQKVTSESQIVAANSHSRYSGSEKGTEKVKRERWSKSEIEAKALPLVAAKLEKSSSVSSKKLKQKRSTVSSAVPFKWEVEPGKPKVEEKGSRSPEAAPALQLPPRLASSSSMKRTSWSASAPPSRRNSTASSVGARQTARSLSASAVSMSSSAGKYFLQSQEAQHSSPQPSPSPSPSQEAKPFRTLPKAFRSSPLDNTGRPSDCTPRRTSQAPISSQFGSPQYQTACEDSDSWKRVRSPTSTLCGPGSDSHSNLSSCISDKSSSRKSSVSFSHSQSGTSAESFEQWSYGDHISPTSRHPSIRESEGFSRANSVRGHEEGDHIPAAADGAMTKLRRKLNLKSSSSKPPMSPIQSSLAAPAASTRSVDANGYSSHGEEYFDCHGSSPSLSSNPKKVELHFDTEGEPEAEPPTRLPYKMPSPVHDIKAASPPSSPPRGGAEFSNCLALPRFLSKGDTPCLWVENPSWNLPDAPRNTVEDGYRSPAYKATLELLSPSPNLLSKKIGSRSASKLPRSSSSRRRHPHLVEVLCNSLKQTLQRCTKRSVARTQSVFLYEDQFTKKHQSFMW